MTARTLAVAALVLCIASPALAQWEEESSRRTRTASDSPGAAPTSLMAPTEDYDENWDKDDKGESFEDVEAARRRRNLRGGERGGASTTTPVETSDWTAPPVRSGLRVIEEDVSVSTTVEFGVEDPDRIGRSLGASDAEGMSLGAPRRPAEGRSFRIRADALDEEPAQPSVKERPKAPMGIVVPADQDFEETPRARRSDDPWGKDAATRRERGGSNRQPSLLDDLSESSGEYGGVRTSTGVGSGDSIPVREVKIDYTPTTTINVDARPSPVVERAATPRPVEPPPAAVEPPSRAVPPAGAASDKTKRAVGRPSREPEKILSYDPFAKLENELAEAEGRPVPAPAVDKPLPEYEFDPPRREEIKRPMYEEPEMAVRPIEAPRAVDTSRDPSLVGLSALVGLGPSFATSPVSGFDTDFAWGFNLRLHPAFAGPISLDLSFWRAARSEGTPVMTVDSARNHISARVFYTKDYPKGLFMGFGGGLVMTGSSAEYLVNDGSPESASASQYRPGGDVTAVLGLRFKPMEVRLDLRTIVRGGLRLEFLPVVSFGVSI